MAEQNARDYWDDGGLVLLWSAMLAGPVAFGFHLQVGYALVKWACSRDARWTLSAVALAALALALAGAWLGWVCLARVRGIADERGGTTVDRSYFMAQVAIGLNLLIALFILNSAFPRFLLSPCE